MKITRKFLNVVIAMVCTVSVFYGVQTVSAVEVIQETEYSVSMDSITDAEILAEEPTQQPTEAPTEAQDKALSYCAALFQSLTPDQYPISLFRQCYCILPMTVLQAIFYRPSTV